MIIDFYKYIHISCVIKITQKNSMDGISWTRRNWGTPRKSLLGEIEWPSSDLLGVTCSQKILFPKSHHLL